MVASASDNALDTANAILNFSITGSLLLAIAAEANVIGTSE